MSDNIATLSAVTGVDAETAQHVLESFGDMDRAVNFILENGEQGVATLQSFSRDGSSHPEAQEPIDLEGDEPVGVPSQSPEPEQSGLPAAERAAAERRARNQGWLEEEAALQQALEASKVTGGGGSSAGSGAARGGRSSRSMLAGSLSQRQSASEQEVLSDSDVEEYEPEVESDVEMDTEEEYMAKLAAAQAAAQRRAHGSLSLPPGGASTSTAAGLLFGELDDDHGPRIRGNRPSGATAAAAQRLHDLNAFSHRLGEDEEEDWDGLGASALGTEAGGFDAGAGLSGGLDAGLPDMPAGVDVEEARMLEAAMLGIPYTGRIPDFANGGSSRGLGGAGGAAAVLSPGVRAQRAIREEQDWAYQASLQADQEKAAAEEAAQRAAEEESARLAADAEAAAAAAAEAEAALKAKLAAKKAALPPEPPAGAVNVVTVLIRLPGGQRLTRKFAKSDALRALYDFVDTEGPGGEDVAPGSYLLVTNMPRQVYEETEDRTLAEAGLNHRQEMLLLEPKG